MLSVESGASCGASFPVDRETIRSPSFYSSYPDFRGGGPCRPPPALRTGMSILTGTRWARTENVSASRRARAAEAAPGRATLVEPAARRDGFQDYYAVKSHLAGASWRGAGTRAFRSEIARRHAGGPRLSRPYPRRPRRGAAGRSAPGAGRRDVGPYHKFQPRSSPSHVPAPATFQPQPRSRRGFGGGAVRPVAESGGQRAFARFGPCAENVQGAFRRGRKCFSPRVSWGRAGNRDRLSRKIRDTGC